MGRVSNQAISQADAILESALCEILAGKEPHITDAHRPILATMTRSEASGKALLACKTHEICSKIFIFLCDYCPAITHIQLPNLFIQFSELPALTEITLFNDDEAPQAKAAAKTRIISFHYLNSPD